MSFSMRVGRVLRCVLSAALMALSHPAAQGCSLNAGYLRPTNYELVRLAPAVVLAKAVATRMGNGTPDDPAQVVFAVQEVVKGSPPSSTLTLHGVADAYDGASPDDSFEGVRPGAQRGACNAYDYRVGATYLLFLGMGWRADDLIGSPPYSRINEEARQGSPWLTAVRQYARIAALNDPEAERRELQALLARAKSSRGDPQYPAAMVVDIERHFASPTPYKTFAELLALLERRGADRGTQADALQAMATAAKPEARSLFERALRTGAWRSNVHAVSDFVVNTRDEQLASMMLAHLASTRDETRRQVILRTSVTASSAQDAPRMLQALRTATPQETRQLARWFARFPSTEAARLLKRRLKLDDAEDFALAFVVAGFGDADVLAWGHRLIASRQEHAWMGFYVVAHSPLPLADELARRIIQSGDEESLVWLVQGYENSTNPNLWDRLADVAALRTRPPKVDIWLEAVLKQRVRSGDVRAAALLKRISGSAEGVTAPSASGR